MGNEALTTIALIIVLVGTMLLLDRRFDCKCGRSARWYFYVVHERAGLMLGYTIFYTLWNVLWIITELTPLSVLFGVPLSCWYFLRYWKHEKGKIKKAVMGLGRVKVNEHGRLKVVTE